MYTTYIIAHVFHHGFGDRLQHCSLQASLPCVSNASTVPGAVIRNITEIHGGHIDVTYIYWLSKFPTGMNSLSKMSAITYSCTALSPISAQGVDFKPLDTNWRSRLPPSLDI